MSQGENGKIEVLRDLTVGQRVAEDEADRLEEYFVETDQWRRIEAGDIDVVYGPKGSGKSAIYSTLTRRESAFFDRGILILPGENPRGSPAFADLVLDPPTSEREFVSLWKLYLLILIARLLLVFEIKNEASRHLFDALSDAGLLPEARSALSSILRAAHDYVRRVQSIEGGQLPDGGVGGRITFHEPDARERQQGVVSVDFLLLTANDALAEAQFSVWVLLDRLDVAFSESQELEKNALRALFKVYLDTISLDRLHLKVFLRTDIWRAITDEGFREASHIVRQLTISWDRQSLMKLVVQRFIKNPSLVTFYGVTPKSVIASDDAQRSLFYRLFPDQVDAGSRRPETFDWLLSHTADGTGNTAPRELIHLLAETRNAQLRRLENGEDEPPDELLFGRPAIRDALPQVSRVRLEQSVYAEYPRLKPYIEALEGQKTEQTVASLSRVWTCSPDDAAKIAGELVNIGFFEQRGSRANPSFWVPFLHRSALRMVQGSAEPS